MAALQPDEKEPVDDAVDGLSIHFPPSDLLSHGTESPHSWKGMLISEHRRVSTRQL